jgi:hypothetical protein
MDGNSYNSLLSEVRWYFAQCVFNSSCYYKASGRCKKAKAKRDNWTLGFAVFAVISVFAQVITLRVDISILIQGASYFSLLVSAGSMINQIVRNDSNNDQIISYKVTAEEYKELREKFFDLLRKIYERQELSLLDSCCTEYIGWYSHIGKMAISTTYQDYKDAQHSLGLDADDEEFTWTNEQIDKLLPDGLKLKDFHYEHTSC